LKEENFEVLGFERNFFEMFDKVYKLKWLFICKADGFWILKVGFEDLDERNEGVYGRNMRFLMGFFLERSGDYFN